MVKNLFKNKWVKNVLQALAIMFGGFFLFNVVFMIYGIFGNLPALFLPDDFAATHAWYPPLLLGVASILILTGIYFILRSKIATIWKAIAVPVPTAIILVILGLSTYRFPALTFALGAIFVSLTFYWFYRTKQPWQYYFGVGYTAILLSGAMLLGVEI